MAIQSCDASIDFRPQATESSRNAPNNPGGTSARHKAGEQPAYWSGVFAMTLCAFALVASEFMPVSLLTPVAADLKISEGLAGQAISISGVFAVLTSLSITALAGRMSRKTLLLWMTGLKRCFYGTLIVIPLLMAMIALTLIAFGSSVTAVFALLGVWGLVATAAPVGWWTWVARTTPENTEAGGGLMVAVVQLAIGLGSTVGGLLFDLSGYQSTFVASAGLLLISAFLAFLASRVADSQRRRQVPVRDR